MKKSNLFAIIYTLVLFVIVRVLNYFFGGGLSGNSYLEGYSYVFGIMYIYFLYAFLDWEDWKEINKWGMLILGTVIISIVSVLKIQGWMWG